MKIEPSKKIYVSESTIHGLGVFANQAIKEGELIEECPIYDLNIPYGFASDTLIDYRFNWPQGVEWEKQVVSWGYGSLYNHSDNPNAYWTSDSERGTFKFYASREILSDEEIFVYYGDSSYWEDGRSHTNVK